MGKTAFATNNALTKKAWEEKLYRDSVKETFFASMAGETSDNIVQVQTDLTKDKGDQITFGLRMKLSGTGVTEGTVLEGNEENLSTYDYSITLAQYRHAVRDKGEMDRQRPMLDVDEESKMALKDWGTEKSDQLAFDAIFASPTRVAYRDGGATGAFKVASGGSAAATAKAALSASYKANASFLKNLVTWAKNGGNRSIVPLRPVMIGGKKYFVLLTHGDVVDDLKNDSTIQAAWQNAAERGSDNPFFKDAEIIWNGLVVKSHENCTLGTDAGGGSNVAWCKSVLLGAQALVKAEGKRGKVVAKTFDYDNEHGYAWGMITKWGKPKFNSEDYGSIGVYIARTQISDV